MSQSLPQLHELSVSERIQLVEDLWDSIAAESPDAVALTHAQRQEVRKRLDAHDADPGSAIAWDALRDSLFDRKR